MHSFTQEDLVQYMYKETSPEKTSAIKAALQQDWNLNEQYKELLSTQQSLNTVNVAPRKKALEFIMNYAEKSARKSSTLV